MIVPASEVELLLDRLHTIEDRITAHGQENRSGLAAQTQEMRALFAKMGEKLDSHEREDQAVERRVLILEEDRRSGADRRKEERERINRQMGFIVTGINLIMGAVYFIGRMVWEAFKK